TITQAWVELEYHRSDHRELGTTPLRRFLDGHSVSRPAPSAEQLRRAFRTEVSRRQRRSDGTVSLAGVRFEVPARFRHLQQLHLRYSRWDLSCCELVDERSGHYLTTLYPLDKRRHADHARRHIAASTVATSTPRDIPPLLKKLLAEFAATGLPPAFLSSHDDQDHTDES
ncbi:MAG: IS481 family transposase, partial [Gemmatimonadales bacterium]